MELLETIPLSKVAKIELYENKNRLYMAQIKSQTGADFIINGGLFNSAFRPVCNVKANGKVLSDPKYTEYGYAWNEGPDITYGKLPSVRSSYLGCVGLVLAGFKQALHYPSALGGCRQRSAVALKGQNLILYACNGVHSKTPKSLQDYAMRKGWDSCLMLDGGGSVQCAFPSETLKSTENNGNGRIVQNYILVYLKKASTSGSKATQSISCPYKEPTVTVKSGTRGDAARWVQWHLAQIGYDVGKIDGIFGTKSVNALLRFQKSVGLDADGMCGRLTRAKLKEKLKE